ncbi:MAG: 3-dehydroquinate synthase, partial [Phycisphaerales bacterium]|nr:3-dehydroquinate synthase [Phycisphaerales bacterium]
MINASFEVNFVHRLRFTRDALDPGNPAWHEVMAPTAGGPARVLAFIDSGLAGAWPGLEEAVTRYAEAHPRSLQLVGAPLIVPGGEVIKNDRRHVDWILQSIHDAHICRQSYVTVFGGGAVLDAVGYAAAIAHRGIRLVRFPTTT